MKTLSNIRTQDLTTDAEVSIHKFVEKGMTELTDDKETAKQLAKQRNSYYYPVYENGKTCGIYGVPK